MTFNHVKNSDIFKKKRFDVAISDVEDQDFNEWLKNANKQSFSTLEQTNSKKSEDGWPKPNRRNHALSYLSQQKVGTGSNL